MTRWRLLPLLIGTALFVPGLALGQQADDPWGGLRANGERPAPAPRAAAPAPRPTTPAAAPAAPVRAATPAPAATSPAAASPATPAPTVATPARPAAAPASLAAPLPLPRPAEAPPREVVTAAPAPEVTPAEVPAEAVAPEIAGGEDVPATDSQPQEAAASPAPVALVDPIAAAAARSESAPPARMPSFPGDRPLVATAYGIMAAFAPISEAAAAVPPVTAEVPPPAALPRTEARVMDAVPAGPRPGTPAIPVAPAPVVMPAASPVAPPVASVPAAPVPAAAQEAGTPPVARAAVPPAATVPIPVAPAQVAPSSPPPAAPAPVQAAPARNAPVQTALANPAAVISGPGNGAAPLGKVEPSPGSVRAPLWPQDLVRALRRAQDSMAQGSAPALEAQRTLIARIEQEFATADASTWQQPTNARAAVTYFLSGGNPAILRRMMDMQPPPAIDPRLLRGTLAYLEGREEESLRQLKDIDARALPPSLGGQVALAQAALHVRKDPAKSAQLLAVARLLAPGTLVEEAALRRAILIASQLGDAAQFEYLSKQYLFRFRNSVYAGNFRQRFAAALSRIGFGNDPAQFHRLDAMLDMLEPDSRREMELTVARAAVVQGLTTTANFAADRALAALPDGSEEAERARLYRGASLAANPNTYKEALTDLGAVDRDRLAPSDAALHAAASATAETVRRATDTQPVLAPKAAQAAGPLAKDEMLPVMDRARAAINNADAILKGTAR